jgi:hypothetical protein
LPEVAAMLSSLFVLTMVLANDAAPTDAYALVVTNNRSLEHSRADLRYADDDGVAWAQLFDERLGARHTVLLTALDEETQRLAPGLTQVPSPTLVHLEQAVHSLAASIESSKQRGSKVEVYVVLAGHGDVSDGVGYLELLDGRLTAGALADRVVAPLAKADRLHLIVDSCNSYYLLNPRQPGARRWAASGLPTGELTARFPNVGALLSTSAEAISYEWSELQSGIFSYEVRSGLRGAADADGDGRITYPELAAFIGRANEEIANSQFRPRVTARAPKADPQAALFELGPGPQPRRLTIRDELGVRVADVHQEAGTALRLSLPSDRGELGVYEEVDGGERPRLVFHAWPVGFRGDLGAVPESEPSASPRGENQVFSSLFRKPFGKTAFAAYLAAPPSVADDGFGVTTEDMKRLEQRLEALVEDDRQERVGLAGLVGLLSGFGARPPTPGPVYWGLLESVRVSEPQLLLRRFRSFEASSDEARARAVMVTERDFRDMARRSMANRVVASAFALTLGSGLMAALVVVANQTGWDGRDGGIGLFLMAGGTMLTSLITLTVWHTAVEREWDNYVRTELEPRGVDIALTAGLGGLGFRATF